MSSELNPTFTPGPWSVQAHHIHVEGKGNVASVEQPWNDAAERQANARLIAAAPGLYDMLEIAARTIETINETFEDHGLDWCENAEAVAKASRAILAKARGVSA